MADLIHIEHEDSPDVWDLHDTVPWTDGSWTADGPFFDGVTYNYRARREIDGVYSEYSNEVAVVYRVGRPYYYYAQQ